MSKTIRVTVWNEYRHEKDPKHPSGSIYPEGIHGAIAKHLRTQPDLQVRTATLDEPEHGLGFGHFLGLVNDGDFDEPPDARAIAPRARGRSDAARYVFG